MTRMRSRDEPGVYETSIRDLTDNIWESGLNCVMMMNELIGFIGYTTRKRIFETNATRCPFC